ncbi:hypothetical protein [Nitrosospira sp. Nsp2]|uniref:hypothetical protein n=1 Tax=Nitrosospira sp. Nsp2 TaxID=136548 RepID=UPI0011B1E8F7|nr:hypothetical protein [Nitrosospira sp. Nsp2]
MQEWNDLNAAERRLVLLPLRWETHSAPKYGERPQEIINQQVVDRCDLLVGIFWTRVGSPTGMADSGTIEELERVASEGKPVMLYFSQAKQDPDKLDLEQLAKLREFKKKTFPHALVESYSDVIEFKDKLSKQIEMQLRTLLAERAESDSEATSVRPVTDIILRFADPDKGEDVGAILMLKTKVVDVTDFESIPDFTPPKTEKKNSSVERITDVLTQSWLTNLQISDSNKNYYRQRVTALVLKEFFRPIRFWLKNRGGIGARDVYIDLNIHSNNGRIIVVSKHQLPTSLPSRSSSRSGLLGDHHPESPDELISSGSDSWNTKIEVRALQPQRELSPATELFIGTPESCDVIITAKIFADTLAQPEIQELALRIDVDKMVVQASEIVSEIILPTTEADQARDIELELGGSK